MGVVMAKEEVVTLVAISEVGLDRRGRPPAWCECQRAGQESAGHTSSRVASRATAGGEAARHPLEDAVLPRDANPGHPEVPGTLVRPSTCASTSSCAQWYVYLFSLCFIR